MAIADMFLDMKGVTGEARDEAHKDKIEVVSWAWGVDSALRRDAVGGLTATRRPVVHEVTITKRLDRASVTLVNHLVTNKETPEATLLMRKAGERDSAPFVYFKAKMEKVRVTSVKTETEGHDAVEKVTLAFDKVTLTYSPQGDTGGKGGGDVEATVASRPAEA